MEIEKSQPLSPWIGSLIFPTGILAAKHYSVPTEFLLWGVVFVFWGLTALVAYRHFREEMSTFSITGFVDYMQRHALLRQCRNTDFGKPLLLTDWYQKALDLAQQPQQPSPVSKDNS